MPVGHDGVQVVSYGSPEWELVKALRVRVFVDEQKYELSDEFDEHDAAALHLALLEQGECIGTCRLMRVTDAGGNLLYYKLGRMAARKEQRGRGIGSAIVRRALDIARQNGSLVLKAHSQVPVVPFYESLGFVPEGDEFLEDGTVRTLVFSDRIGTPHRLVVAPL